MQIGEQDLAFAELHPFGGLRLLHLHDHLRPGEDLGRARGDLGADRDVVGIRRAHAGAGAGFDQDLMADARIFARRLRGQADAIFVNLDFLQDTDAHLPFSPIRQT